MAFERSFAEVVNSLEVELNRCTMSFILALSENFHVHTDPIHKQVIVYIHHVQSPLVIVYG